MVDSPNAAPTDPQSLQSCLNQLQACLQDRATADRPAADIAATIEPVYRRLSQALGAEQVAPARQSYLTEFHKQMRLLGTDIGFLKAAKKAETRAQRLTSMTDRLQLLQRYYIAMTAVE